MTAQHRKKTVTNWPCRIIRGTQLLLTLLCLGLLIPFGGGSHANAVLNADVTYKNTAAPRFWVVKIAAVRQALPARYTIRPGDTLAGVAKRLYGTAVDWGYLWHVNDKLIANPGVIYAGETLIIPPGMPKGYTLDAYLPKPAPKVVTVVSTAPQAVTGGRLSCAGLQQLWDSAGGNPADSFMAAEIAMAESGGNQYALSPTDDYGYWQINASNGALATFNALGNARSAIILSHDGASWSAWTTYRTGAYEGTCR